MTTSLTNIIKVWLDYPHHGRARCYYTYVSIQLSSESSP
jgi:hypothetical protein